MPTTLKTNPKYPQSSHLCNIFYNINYYVIILYIEHSIATVILNNNFLISMNEADYLMPCGDYLF